MIVELFSSTLPADVLYDENSLPRADGELPHSGRIAATDNPPYSGAPHDRAQAPGGDSGAEPLAPIAKRPIALSPSAISELSRIEREQVVERQLNLDLDDGSSGRSVRRTGDALRSLSCRRRQPAPCH